MLHHGPISRQIFSKKTHIYIYIYTYTYIYIYGFVHSWEGMAQDPLNWRFQSWFEFHCWDKFFNGQIYGRNVTVRLGPMIVAGRCQERTVGCLTKILDFWWFHIFLYIQPYLGWWSPVFFFAYVSDGLMLPLRHILSRTGQTALAILVGQSTCLWHRAIFPDGWYLKSTDMENGSLRKGSTSETWGFSLWFSIALFRYHRAI